MAVKLGAANTTLYLGNTRIKKLMLNGAEVYTDPTTIPPVDPPVTEPVPPSGTAFSRSPSGDYLVFPNGEYAVQPTTA